MNLFYFFITFICTLTFACTTTPTPSDQPQKIQETSNQQDPLQTAERWLKTGLSTQNLPIHTDFYTQTQSWNSPHVTRLTLIPNTEPTQYNAIITDSAESPDHALQLTITQNQNTWTITQIQQTPARTLWPRF